MVGLKILQIMSKLLLECVNIINNWYNYELEI